MGLFVFKNSVISLSKSGCNSFLPESREHRCRNKQALCCSISLPNALCPPGLVGEAPKPRQPPRLGQHRTRGDPNPSQKLRLSRAAREEFTRETLPALDPNSPKRCHGPRAKAEPPKLGCSDLNSRGGLDAKTARRTCLSASAAAALQVQGRGLSSTPVRLPDEKFLRERLCWGDDAVLGGAGSSQARGRKGSGVYSNSSKTWRSRI